MTKKKNYDDLVNPGLIKYDENIFKNLLEPKKKEDFVK